jgi:two-component sensor histidine kinase
VKLTSVGEGLYELVVRDNGAGMKEQTDARQTNPLGLRLVNAFVRNLNATMEVSVSRGTSTKVRFRRDK